MNFSREPANLEKELFAQALERTPEKRQAFLLSSCHGDEALLQRITHLLQLHESAEVILPPTPRLQDWHSIVPEPGTCIGRYRLLRVIGEGGFGVVFLAEQLAPLQRKVALKIIKAGMDTKQVIARFEAERQALALMDHPNIAKILDAGATDQGRPYFVMELVPGIPVTTYCEEHQLSIRERLKLFIHVCQAIQHAHHKGIIHRDIKPTNVLVTIRPASERTLPGGVAHPMVIDFGVAKAINQRLTEKTLFTQFAHMIGTPAYMSPEQAERSPSTAGDVDTRSDVYSLGILLYEMLTGTTPFSDERLKTMGLVEIQRVICEEDPVRPSTVLSQLNGRLKTIAANRKSEPEKLVKAIQGDLDWIILKAIEKKRDQRYPTPLDLAKDLERHLVHQPVSALPPRFSYQVRKYLRRNRVGILIVMLLLSGTMVSFWQAGRATRAQALAEQKAVTAEAAITFIQEDLSKAARLQPHARFTDVIQAAMQGMDEAYRDEPQVKAAIHLTAGKLLLGLEDFERAEIHLTQAIHLYEETLGRDHDKTLDAKLALVRLMFPQSRKEETEALCEEILESRQTHWGREHPKTLEVLTWLGNLYDWTTRHAEAEAVLLRVLDACNRAASPDYMIMHDALQGLAWVAASRGQYMKIVELRHQAYQIAREHFGPDDPQTLNDACFRVQHLNLWLHQYQEALALAEDTLERCLRILGRKHSTTIWIRIEMINLEELMGLMTLDQWRENLHLWCQIRGTNNWTSLLYQGWFGSALIRQDFGKEGFAALNDALERSILMEGRDTLLSRQLARRIADGHTQQGRLNEAEEMLMELLHEGRGVLRREAPWLKEQTHRLFNVLARQGKWSEAMQAHDALYAEPDIQPRPLATGLLVANLAGDGKVVSNLGQRAVKIPTEQNDPVSGFALTQALLLSLDQVMGVDLPQTLSLCRKIASLQEDPRKQLILSSLVSCRSHDWTQILEDTSTLPPQAEADMPSVPLFMRVVALSQTQQAKTARVLFQSLQEPMQQALAAGDLGRHWRQLAPHIVAWQAASMELTGSTVAELSDPTLLAKSRGEWQPVEELLRQGDRKARASKWEEALALFHEAIDHPRFTWAAVSRRDSQLSGKLAVLYLLAGRPDSYQQFCQGHILDGRARYLQAIDLQSERSRHSLKRARLNLSAIPDDQQSAKWRHWAELRLGMALYRHGNFSEALGFLNSARQAFNLNCSGMAAAFASMTAAQSGQTNQAALLLEKGRQSYRRLMDRNADDLGASWKDTAVLQIALEEAQFMIQ